MQSGTAPGTGSFYLLTGSAFQGQGKAIGLPGEEVLLELAQWAGTTVVAAALTDAWESARTRVAKVFGRGSARKTEAAEAWLDRTRDQLAAAAPGTDLEQVAATAAGRWAGRFADLLDEDPGLAADLRAVVTEVAALLPAAGVSAADHSVAAGRDVTIISAGRAGTAIGRVDLQRRPAPDGMPVRLAPRPPFLAGREELLAELHSRLTASRPGHAEPGERPGSAPVRADPQVVALCGLGGAGKTSVAVEYAHRHLPEAGLCWQLPAEDPALLAAESAVLAAELGARDVADSRDPVAS